MGLDDTERELLLVILLLIVVVLSALVGVRELCDMLECSEAS